MEIIMSCSFFPPRTSEQKIKKPTRCEWAERR
jgi:hypothetical protein